MYEKKLDISSHQGNKSQNHNEKILHTHLRRLETNSQITSVGKNVEKLDSLYTAGGSVKWYSHY